MVPDIKKTQTLKVCLPMADISRVVCLHVVLCLRRGRAWLGTVPDEGCVLRADEHKQAHAHQLLRGQQDVLVVPGDVLLQLGRPQLLVGGAEGDRCQERARAEAV